MNRFKVGQGQRVRIRHHLEAVTQAAQHRDAVVVDIVEADAQEVVCSIIPVGQHGETIDRGR